MYLLPNCILFEVIYYLKGAIWQNCIAY